MNELKVTVNQEAGKINCNFAEIEAYAQEVKTRYSGIVVTEDSVAESKKDIATLRKLYKYLDDARKQAEEIGNGAIYYTSDLLTMAEKTIQAAYTNTLNNSKVLEKSLSDYLETVRKNKAELVVDQSSAAQNNSEADKEQMADDLSAE